MSTHDRLNTIKSMKREKMCKAKLEGGNIVMPFHLNEGYKKKAGGCGRLCEWCVF